LGELIKRQVAQLTRLIDDLLEVSRISQGRMQLQFESVLLNDVVEFAVESTSMMMLEKKIHFTYDCDERNLTVRGDYARLVQSVVNLLINATKYTEQGGRININLRREQGQAIIQVKDSGMGIEADMLEKIFELFVQVDKSIDRSQSGLGIGLSIVNTIVQMHGGKVKAQSEGLGKGATFSLSLPLLEIESNFVSTEKGIRLSNLRFLLVDDNEDAANSLAMLLDIIGHNTQVVYTGLDALDIISRDQFDVVLLDIGLPDIDGYKVARSIRDQNANILIIAVTGYGQAEDICQALEQGCNGHLTKPVSLDVLETTINNLLMRQIAI
jgi:CheY-like chemotaxis protein